MLAAAGDNGVPVGFATRTGLVELYAECFLDVGQPAVPTFTEPALSPRSRPDLADELPLVLTCTKDLHFCETQYRQIASLRRRAPDPEVELHPDVADAHGVADGDWVEITTPKGSIRARTSLNSTLAPGVVRTPMTAELLASETMRPIVDEFTPMPYGGHCEPVHVAEVIAFLASAEVERVCGQVLFVDAGADTLLRGDDIW